MKTIRERMREGRTLEGQAALLEEFLVVTHPKAAPDVALIVEAFTRELAELWRRGYK